MNVRKFSPVFVRLTSKSTVIGLLGIVALVTGSTFDPVHLEAYASLVASVSSVVLVLIAELPSGSVATPVAVIPAIVGAPVPPIVDKAAKAALADALAMGGKV